jgi:hypothetical protein
MIDNPTLVRIMTVFLGGLLLLCLWRMWRMFHDNAHRDYRREASSPFGNRRSAALAIDDAPRPQRSGFENG